MHNLYVYISSKCLTFLLFKLIYTKIQRSHPNNVNQTLHSHNLMSLPPSYGIIDCALCYFPLMKATSRCVVSWTSTMQLHVNRVANVTATCTCCQFYVSSNLGKCSDSNGNILFCSDMLYKS